MTRDELESLEAICRERRMALLVDEVFSDYALAAGPDAARSAIGTRDALTFVLSGLSKVAGLPQMKLGWVAVQGPSGERREALERLEHIADTYLSVSGPVQHAASRLLATASPVQSSIRTRLTENLRRLGARANPSLRCQSLPVEGGWYVPLRVSGDPSSADRAVELLDRDGVHVHPGYLFDFENEGYLVASLLTPPQTFSEGVERIEARAAGAEP
jgi:hypothetical protein